MISVKSSLHEVRFNIREVRFNERPLVSSYTFNIYLYTFNVPFPLALKILLHFPLPTKSVLQCQLSLVYLVSLSSTIQKYNLMKKEITVAGVTPS